MASTTPILPAATPPYGQTSDFVHPATQHDAIIGVCTVFLVLTLFFVGLRLYFSTRIIGQSMGAEDYVCIAAAVFSFVNIGMIIETSDMSRHVWDTPAYWLSESYWKRRFPQAFILTSALLTSRLTFLLLYLRLFGSNRKTRYAVYFGCIAVSLLYLIYIPLLPVFCARLLQSSWDRPGTLAKCRKLVPYILVSGVGNIVFDLYIMLLPMPIIWHLQLPFEKKLGVSVLFTTGAIVLIASIVGLVYRIRLTFNRDLTWNQSAFDVISVVEINTAIICSSMPACASFIKRTSANSTFFASVRSTFGRPKPSMDSGTNESRSRSKPQTLLALKTPLAPRHHTSSNAWHEVDPENFNSRTNMANPAWPEPEGSIGAHSEQPEGENLGCTENQTAGYDEESRANKTNGIMKSITVSVTSQKNPIKQ